MSDNPSAASLHNLEQELGVSFKDQNLLQQVFVHRSYLNEHRSFSLGHNERLEFLGDAVLELVVTDHLYRTYPNPEGELTAWRSSLVKGEMLASIARTLNFPQHLLLSYGEAKSGGQEKGYLLANAFEAFIGGLYLDQGYTACEGFIHRYLLNHLPIIIEKKLFIDPKSNLQEYTQQHFGQTPTYELLGSEGPDHAKTFTVVAKIGERTLGQGSGNSKQSAQVAAAEQSLIGLLAE